MSTSLNKWRVVVTATQEFDYIWRDEDEDAPTVSSTGQPIDANKSLIIETLEEEEVKIKEEDTPTGGHFFVKNMKFVCPTGSSTHIMTFPFDINMISTTVETVANMTDDYMKWIVSPNTTIGQTTDSVGVSGSTFNVSSTVIENIAIGFEARIFALPSGPGEDLGIVLNIDKDNSQITTSQSVSQSFGTGSLVQMTIPFMEGYIGYPSKYEYGKDKIGASFLPANVPVYLYYTNNSTSESKDLFVQFQYLY